uniref:Uncharacterized protein n=1 Tax=uncultured marine virus TaxID=186617 RepID=A0A0F7L8J3_9VIRU|nr:hypothetical protein [uncultured marine virus]
MNYSERSLWSLPRVPLSLLLHLLLSMTGWSRSFTRLSISLHLTLVAPNKNNNPYHTRTTCLCLC